MRISEMNWQAVEHYLKSDNRCVLPLGCTEQHAFLSLSTDSILAERVAVEAAEPLGIPVLPVLAYGITPYFRAYPGTISLRIETYLRVVSDILSGLYEHGFRRILIVNGHGGNSPALSLSAEWVVDHAQAIIKFHNWWNAPRTWARVMEIDPVASHASWMENFPWTRLAEVSMPATPKTPIDMDLMRQLEPRALRSYLGDGNFAGLYERPDADMLAIWQVAVEETRALLTGDWGQP